MRSAIDMLAARSGIGEDNDAELKRALLEAMRFRVGTEEEAANALAELDSRAWERALPPVVVAYESGGGVQVPVVVKAGTQGIRWVLTREDGTEEVGDGDAAGLPLVQAREYRGSSLERRVLSLPNPLPWGYHRLRVEGLAGDMTLIVTPGRCWLPDPDAGRRMWGLAVNLFLLRSKRNWGIGDFSDLRELMELAKSLGADVVGVNPIHAMFPDEPEEASPYSPSDRTLLNILYIDVEAVAGYRESKAVEELVESEAFRHDLDSARTAELVQYEAVASLKLKVLRLLFREFEERGDAKQLEELEAFRREGGAALELACTFQAMREYFTSQERPEADCAAWPVEYRSSHSPAVGDFTREHGDLVRFHLWMQWHADSQLRDASAAGNGMSIGLYRDLAVGAHPSGAELWSHPEELVSGAEIGAPPDPLGPAGQNWGLPPLHPIEAKEHSYSSFIALLRANMRYAGGLRMDHAMALERLYWIPKGKDPKHGAYVQYPMEDLIGILALESQRHRCLVVGEDLGTVPEGFRDRMAEANILSYRVLFFEREEKEFIRPEKYPRLALSVASNHDLPTLRGWWSGGDIELKDCLRLVPGGPAAMREERDQDRRALIALFEEEGNIKKDGDVQAEGFSRAAHAMLASSNALLTLVTLDDISGEEVQVNVPGTSSENPNWRRRLSRTMEELGSDPELIQTAALMSRCGRSKRIETEAN